MILTTSFPLRRDHISGVFVHRMVTHLPPEIRVRVVAPADQYEGCTPLGNYHLVCLRYAPRPLRTLAQASGGLPRSLKSNPLKLFALPLLVASLFYGCLRYGRRANLIHAQWALNGAIAGLCGKVLRRPAITTLRGSDVRLAKKSWLHRLLLDLTIRLNERVVAVGLEMQEDLKKRFGARNTIEFIPNGVASNSSDRAQNDGPLRIVTVGSLIAHKGMDVVIAALAAAGNGLELTVVGDGPEMHQLKAQAAQLGVARKIAFTGAVAPDEIPALLATNDVFVLMSLGEGRSNAVLEAMAAGLAVVVAAAPGMSELISHNATGVLVPTGDATALADTLKHLHSQADIRRRLGENARQWVADNMPSWHETGRRYAELYKQVLRAR